MTIYNNGHRVQRVKCSKIGFGTAMEFGDT